MNSPALNMPDAEVLRAAAAMMPAKRQAELADLLADQRESRLSADGRLRLDDLKAEYLTGLLAKAKAVREAVRRKLLPPGG